MALSIASVIGLLFVIMIIATVVIVASGHGTEQAAATTPATQAVQKPTAAATARPVRSTAAPSRSSTPSPAATYHVPAAVAQAAVEEKCDSLAAASFTKQGDKDPVFVNPTFGPGANGAVEVTQDVPYTDPSGTPQTAFLLCSGTLNADNSTSATLIALSKESH